MRSQRVVTPYMTAAPLICSEFRKGRGYENWRPRGSGDWLLIHTLDGAGRIASRGRPVRLAAGGTVLFSPGSEQDYSTDSESGFWHLRWAHFIPRPHWRPWLMWPQLVPGVGLLSLRGAAMPVFGAALERMLGASRLGGAHGEDLALNALEEALLWASRFMADARLSGSDPRIRQAAHYLATRLGKPFRLPALAAHCGLSPSRLSHLFRAELGTTPQRFGEKLRLDHARQLLSQTNLTVGEVAAEAGFEDPFYFSRRFKRTFGRAPTALRG